LPRNLPSFPTRRSSDLEPVLRGELTGNPETVFTYPQDPTFYVSNPGVLATCSSSNPDPNCPAIQTTGPADGSFSQSIRRLGLYRSEEHTSELQSLAYLV